MMKSKIFLKFFLTFLLVFTLIFMPIVKAVSNITLFNTDGIINEGIGLSDRRGVFVAQTGAFYDDYEAVNRVNLLAMGVNNKMTDTIMVASWNMDDNTVDVISVPRDTYYHRTGFDANAQKKINAIYASEGAKKAAEAISDVLYGMEINYYAIVDYDAVRTIVDGVGGVPMDVKRNMYYTDPYDTPPLVIDIKKGQQVLDGDHAVQFLRYRHGYINGDLGRVEAQQEFIKSLFNQCINNGVLSSARLVTENIKSDLTVGAATRYALSAMNIDKESLDSWTLPGVPEYIDETSYYIQDKEATKEMLRNLYAGRDSSYVEGEENEEAADGADGAAEAETDTEPEPGAETAV